MLYSKTIRKFIALVMLVVFAFSITHQKSIHDLVAKHSDPTKCSVHKEAPVDQVENTSIHCSYDNLVVASPFIDYHFPIKITLFPQPISKNTIFSTLKIDNVIHSFESRGPPVI
ncbi:MAG: hypothetical protein ACR2IM_06405 [Sediminibacterium sp.]